MHIGLFLNERKNPKIQNVVDSLHQVTNEIIGLLDNFTNSSEKEKKEDNNGEDKQ